jgi:hypothetical protein
MEPRVEHSGLEFDLWGSLGVIFGEEDVPHENSILKWSVEWAFDPESQLLRFTDVRLQVHSKLSQRVFASIKLFLDPRPTLLIGQRYDLFDWRQAVTQFYETRFQFGRYNGQTWQQKFLVDELGLDSLLQV